MKKLIITADDYGMCESVNEAIEACADAGIVRSLNVMTNMGSAEDAACLRAKYPDAAIGLHFTLTAGKSILPKEKVPSLTDGNGYFYRYPEFCRRVRSGSIKKDEMRAELCAQYEEFVRLCGEPDYWNTHQNLHISVYLFSFFCSLARELSINAMRTHRRIYIPSENPDAQSIKRKLLAPFKTALINKWSAGEEKKGVKMPDGLLVFRNEDEKFDIPYWSRNIEWKQNSLAEICIHPAVRADCEYFGKITDKRIKEYNLFSDPETKEILKNASIEIANMKL